MPKGFSIRSLARLAVSLLAPFLLSACLFSSEPLLDETNSVAARDSEEFQKFLKAWRLAYGGPYSEAPSPPNYFMGEDGLVDLSLIRVSRLGKDALLVQQETPDMSEQEVLYVYYMTRMLAPRWPDNCLADTGESGEAALRALAADLKVELIDIDDYSNIRMDGQRDDMQKFLRAQFTIGPLDCSSDGGMTPLHWTVAGDTDVSIANLVAAGADVNARAGREDCTGLTPLHLAAARHEHPEEIAILVDAGAEIDVRAGGLECAGMTPLHFAARDSNLANIEALLDAGADASLKDAQGLTAFDHLQSFVGNEETDILTSPGYTRLERASRK